MFETLLEYVYTDIAGLIEEFTNIDYEEIVDSETCERVKIGNLQKIKQIARSKYNVYHGKKKTKKRIIRKESINLRNIIYCPDNIKYVINPGKLLIIYAPFAISVEILKIPLMCARILVIKKEIPDVLLYILNRCHWREFEDEVLKMEEIHQHCILYSKYRYKFYITLEHYRKKFPKLRYESLE